MKNHIVNQHTETALAVPEINNNPTEGSGVGHDPITPPDAVCASAAPDYGMPVHPVCDCFPLMTADELQKLVADIKANGLGHKIVVHGGRIIDGRNRVLACRMAGRRPAYVEWREIYSGKMDVNRWIWSTNVERRHLTADQIAAVQAKIHAIPARQKARDRRIDAAKQQGKHGKDGGRGHEKASPAKSPERLSPALDPDGQINVPPVQGTTSDVVPEPKGDTGKALKIDSGDMRDLLAQDAGVSPYKMQQALNVQKEDPGMLEDVIAGNKKLSKAAKEVEAKKAAINKNPPKKTRQAQAPSPRNSKCASDRLPAPNNAGVSTFDVHGAMIDAEHQVETIFKRVPIEDQNVFIEGLILLLKKLRKSPVEISATCEVLN